MSIVARLPDHWHTAGRIRREFGVGRLRQLVECARLARGPGRIGPGDYFNYRLFDPALAFEEKRRFAGWRAEARLDALNDRRWCGLALDKVLIYALLGEQGLPIPDTRAILCRGAERALTGARALAGTTALKSWLAEPAHYPFFSKPAASGFARGTFCARRLLPDGRIELAGAPPKTIEAFCAALPDQEKLGYLFQTPLRTDARLVDTLGAPLSSLRVMVLADEKTAPRIHRAFWKLATGANISDNYNGGRTGNLAAALELTSGRIMRVINGTGLALREIERHPDTGERLAGLAVPDWPAVRSLVLRAALLLPKLRFQHWDVALTDAGPVLLEVNLFGTQGGELSQLLEQRGLIDDDMQSMLQRHRL